jgi:hypothetical protein
MLAIGRRRPHMARFSAPGVCRLDGVAQGTCHLKSGFEPIALFAPRWHGQNRLHRWRRCTYSGLASAPTVGFQPTTGTPQISHSVSCYAQQSNSLFREHYPIHRDDTTAGGVVFFGDQAIFLKKWEVHA